MRFNAYPSHIPLDKKVYAIHNCIITRIYNCRCHLLRTRVECMNSVKRSDVTGSRFWELGEIKLCKTPSPILHCISQPGGNEEGLGN